MMTTPEHDRLAVFLDEWRAEGTSYGGTDQSGVNPRANGLPWTSTHTGRRHTRDFFLIQDERALPGGATFDTLSVMGVDESTGGYFVRSFENHGFYRRYDVSVARRLVRVVANGAPLAIRQSMTLLEGAPCEALHVHDR